MMVKTWLEGNAYIDSRGIADDKKLLLCCRPIDGCHCEPGPKEPKRSNLKPRPLSLRVAKRRSNLNSAKT